MPQLKPATKEDRDFAYQLDCAVYRDVIIKQFGAWDESTQLREFEKKWDPSNFSLEVINVCPVGVLAVERFPDHINLSEIQILPAFQNQGHGTDLLKRLMKEARVSYRPLRLKVFKMSNAVTLYQRLGFEKTSETDTHFHMEWRAD